MTDQIQRTTYAHHGFEAPFNRGDTIPLSLADLPVLAERHGLTQLQRDVAIHVFVRKTSYRATAAILQKPAASVRQAATAVANKLGYASPNAVHGSATFATTFVHGAVPQELHSLLHAMVDDFVATAEALQHQDDARFAPMLVQEVPIELRDLLRDKIAGTVAKWLEQQGEIA